MKKFIGPLITGIFLISSLFVTAQVYIQFEGVDGEARAAHLKGFTEISSVEMGASSSGSTAAVRAGTGMSAGKVSVHDISFSKPRGSSSAALQTALFNGRNIAKAEIRFYKTGSTTQYLTIVLENVFITSWKIDAGNGGAPTESFSLNYVKFRTEDQVPNADGSIRKITSGWDVQRNIAN